MKRVSGVSYDAAISTTCGTQAEGLETVMENTNTDVNYYIEQIQQGISMQFTH